MLKEYIATLEMAIATIAKFVQNQQEKLLCEINYFSA